MTEPVLTRRFDAGGIDLRRTVQSMGMYGGDMTHRFAPQRYERAVLTPVGPGTMRLSWTAAGTVDAEAWGSGKEWLLDRAPDWLGVNDDPTGFDVSQHQQVATWWRQHGTVRLAASGVVWQELVPALLGQRVTTEEAIRSWNRMCRLWGEPAPGPCELRLPPSPAVLASLSYVDFHTVNVERRRADVIKLAGKRANRLEEAATMSPTAAIQRLTALDGLGAWTATGTVIACHGDPDTILLRDYGMPTLVNYAFTGETKRLPPDDGGDEIMCRHLAPWAGHRQRLVRLMSAAGVSVPRRAPKALNPDIRRL